SSAAIAATPFGNVTLPASPCCSTSSLWLQWLQSWRTYLLPFEVATLAAIVFTHHPFEFRSALRTFRRVRVSQTSASALETYLDAFFLTATRTRRFQMPGVIPKTVSCPHSPSPLSTPAIAAV